jgi:preprotein translocase subunit YajC
MSPAVLVFVVALILVWVLMARGPRRRQREQQRMWETLQVGDEIVTAGGIYGEITALRDDGDVMVRIAPELEVRVARRAIAGLVEEEAPAEPTDEEPR